jgi:hypothetical protein
MSAFLCNDALFSRLAHYVISGRFKRQLLHGAPAMVHPFRFENMSLCGAIADDRQTAREIGQLLKWANIESLRVRYPHYPDMWEHPDFAYDHEAEVSVYYDDAESLGQIIKDCDCFDYQSCEWGGWVLSWAQILTAAIRAHAIESLPTYRSAHWG